MTDKTQPKRKLRVFACGGAGTNIGHKLEELRDQGLVGYADIEIAYIDTSRSNLHADISHKHVYLIDGLDGSGGIRSDFHVPIAERIKDILQNFKPGDANVVIGSLGGGSGSVIAPLMVSELLAREAPVVAFGIGDNSTRKRAENTLGTIKSYEAIAQQREAPVVMVYYQNGETRPRSQVDQDIKSDVSLLSALFSGENREMDSRDLFNWLRFSREKVTTFKPQLATLTIVHGSEARDPEANHDLGNIISIATIAREDEDTTFARRPEYQTTGFVSADFPGNVAKAGPHHFVISDGIIPDVVRELQGVLGSMREEQDARQNRRTILESGDRPTDSGLVF